MARKDPPGLIYVGSGVEVEAEMKDNDVVVIKVRRWMPDGSKRGGTLALSLECLRLVREAGSYDQLAFVAEKGQTP